MIRMGETWDRGRVNVCHFNGRIKLGRLIGGRLDLDQGSIDKWGFVGADFLCAADGRIE